VREIDTVGRYGGDEFGVILCELDADPAIATDQAKRVAEKVRSHLAEPYILSVKSNHTGPSGIQHHCSASIGLCLFGYKDSSAQDGFRDADLAKDQAKAGGGNQVNGLSRAV
jgi:diguanylate cyclase (GGDEF)-like protein